MAMSVGALDEEAFCGCGFYREKRFAKYFPSEELKTILAGSSVDREVVITGLSAEYIFIFLHYRVQTRGYKVTYIERCNR